MHPPKSALWLTAIIAISVAGPIGCTDTGDTSSLAPTSDSGASPDTTNPVDAASSDDATTEASEGADAASPPEASDESAAPNEPEDTGATAPPTNSSTSPPDEAGLAEAKAPNEAGAPVEGGAPEAGPPPAEAGAPDAGLDAGAHDAATGDSGAIDAATADAGVHDAGGQDATVADGGGPASGADAGGGGGHDGGGRVPCTATGQTGCVKCPGSPTSGNGGPSDGLCTPTEALFVDFDIARGNLDATGQLKAFAPAAQGSCYSCLNAKGCLDDNSMDTGLECGDSPDLMGAAAKSGVTQCLTTLSCILSTDCQGEGGISGTSAVASQESIQLCYCGGNNAGSVCSTAGSATNGLCVTEEAAGFGFATTDNKDILANYGTSTFPSGVANGIFNCATSNKCTICQ